MKQGVEMNSLPEEPSMSEENARIEIMSIRAEIALLGANDSEFSTLDGIVDELKAHSITPEEALRRAGLVRDSKADYH